MLAARVQGIWMGAGCMVGACRVYGGMPGAWLAHAGCMECGLHVGHVWDARTGAGHMDGASRMHGGVLDASRLHGRLAMLAVWVAMQGAWRHTGAWMAMRGAYMRAECVGGECRTQGRVPAAWRAY
eukprot:359818-Chlamydomonas_euryale.AAC.2